jgi:transcriptional regulator with GAF, ATPase, and Fis domain
VNISDIAKLELDMDSQDVALTFIEITRWITQGVETIEVLSSLAERCVSLLPVSASGILLRDLTGSLQVVGASSKSAHLLDLFQIQNDQGPCLECSNSGKAVADSELTSNGPWPEFSKRAREEGFVAVYALPLISKDLTIGALNLFATQKLTSAKLAVAQALADAATLSLMQVDPKQDLQIVIRQVHLAVETRNTLEQAKGMISQRFDIDAESAFIKIRDIAYETNQSLVSLATSIVMRDSENPGLQRIR